MTEEQINETLTALLAPLLTNCTLSVSHKMHTQVHGTAWVGLKTKVNKNEYYALVSARFVVENNIVSVSNWQQFRDEATTQLGKQVFAA